MDNKTNDLYTKLMSQERFQERFHSQNFVKAFKSDPLPQMGDGNLSLPSVISGLRIQGNVAPMHTRCVNGNIDDSIGSKC